MGRCGPPISDWPQRQECYDTFPDSHSPTHHMKLGLDTLPEFSRLPQLQVASSTPGMLVRAVTVVTWYGNV